MAHARAGPDLAPAVAHQFYSSVSVARVVHRLFTRLVHVTDRARRLLAFRPRIHEFIRRGLPAIFEAGTGAHLPLKLNSIWHCGLLPFWPEVVRLKVGCRPESQ